jgi:predicted pyridoxine 5'-phosphate oxidase superfamily flavin-nucleotide-binding protein
MDYAQRVRLKLLGRLAVQDLAPRGCIGQDIVDPAYRARPQRAMVITVEGFDWNCPQHIPVRIDAEDVQRALDQRDARIAELEARIAHRAAGSPASG